MDRIKQVCSLEQSKRLKELGVDGSTCFWEWWFTEFNTRDGKDSTTMLKSVLSDPTSPSTETYPAFTVAELGVMLPLYYYSYEGDAGREWYCLYDGNESQYEKYEFTNSKTEAQARAAMLIYLLENKLITAEECNARLAD